jgi:hypothetical protein
MSWKPIITFAIAGKDGNHETLKVRFKSKLIPNEGDIVYFNYNGPYYSVDRVFHHIQLRHHIFIMVKPLEMNEKKNN